MQLWNHGIDKIIDRGEKLDIIVDKTDALADTADVFDE